MVWCHTGQRWDLTPKDDCPVFVRAIKGQLMIALKELADLSVLITQ